MIADLLLTFFLVFLNGFFVAAEFALVKVRHSQLQVRTQQGQKMARLALHLVDHLDAYLSATQLGITIASIGLGWIGESVVAEMIATVLAVLGIGIDPQLVHQISLPLAFGVITFLHITLGELFPKSLAIRFPEAVTLGVAYPMRFFYVVLYPFIVVLNGFANWILRIVGLEASVEHGVHSPEELQYVLEQSIEKAATDPIVPQLVQNVFRFARLRAHHIMVPRTEIVAVDIMMPLDTILELVVEEGYSRLPVNIVGILYVKDLLTLLRHPQLIVLTDILRSPFFVPETMPVSTLLQTLQQHRVHLAIVQDEFGGTAGLVTMEDVLEALVGEIHDEYDEEEPEIIPQPDGSFVAWATTPIHELNAILPRPLPESDRYDTLGGLLIYHCERLPEKNEKIRIDGYEFTVLERSERRLEKIRIQPLAETDYSSE